jgi:ABC-type polysaccharide/polyol phosphate export permease
VPRSAFAVASIVTYWVNWLIALIPLLGIMLVLRQPFSWSLLTVPLGMVLTALFAFGVGLIVATLGAFFHDVHLTYQVLLTAWLYATPIIYPLSIVENERLRDLFRLNPLLHLCELVRTPVYEGHAASLDTWAIGLAVSLSAALLGWWTFTHWRAAFDYRS